MIAFSRNIVFVALLSLCFSWQAAAATRKPDPPAAAPSNVVAEVEGEKITSEQLEKGIATQLGELQEQIYKLKKQALDSMINDRLLENEAKRQKISVSELVDKEVTARAGLVTEQEIDTFYDQNKDRIKGTAQQAKTQIRPYLQNQRLTGEREKYLQTLRTKGNVAISLKGPAPVRVEVASAGPLPFKGDDTAQITIVKFEDFQCPYCKAAQGTLSQLEAKYAGKIKIVHRDFPIDGLHPVARRASEGGRCANEQGKFWAYHDKIYGSNLGSDASQLSNVVKDVGLDMAAFDACLSSGKYASAVQNDLDQGQKLGVVATPAFFVNGRLLMGAQPLDAFSRVIDEELALATAKAK